MTVDQRRNEAAVDKSWKRDVLGARCEAGYGRLAVPQRSNVQPDSVEPAAAVTVSVIVGVEVLYCASGHHREMIASSAFASPTPIVINN
jgi:hypothetical protein